MNDSKDLSNAAYALSVKIQETSPNVAKRIRIWRCLVGRSPRPAAAPKRSSFSSGEALSIRNSCINVLMTVGPTVQHSRSIWSMNLEKCPLTREVCLLHCLTHVFSSSHLLERCWKIARLGSLCPFKQNTIANIDWSSKHLLVARCHSQRSTR